MSESDKILVELLDSEEMGDKQDSGQKFFNEEDLMKIMDD